jgi:hypothetical protein
MQKKEKVLPVENFYVIMESVMNQTLHRIETHLSDVVPNILQLYL